MSSAARRYDVFLSYNRSDHTEVLEIAGRLASSGITPWIDSEQLRPGLPWQRALEKQIPLIASAAVFIGRNGRRPWQNVEIDAFLREFARRNCPVIPVLLESSKRKPRLPAFLQGMTWVDFRLGQLYGVEQLVWGITGVRPAKNGLSGSPARGFGETRRDVEEDARKRRFA